MEEQLDDMHLSDAIRVLHVDDSPSITDLTKAFLKRENHKFQVETAETVDEAQEYLRANSIDCVVSDYEMPGEDGLDFLKIVRNECPDLPFILYTGKGSEEIASQAISAGVTDYVQKSSRPSQYTVLANRIQNAVEQYWSRKKFKYREDRLLRQQQALVDISTSDEFLTGDLQKLAQCAAERACQVLAVERVCVWLATEKPNQLDCITEYRAVDGKHTTSEAIQMQSIPRFLSSLAETQVVTVEDTTSDDRVHELQDLLDEKGIEALIAAPIRANGAIVGVVLVESVGQARVWETDEIQFTQNITSLIHQAVQMRDRDQNLQNTESGSQGLSI